MLHSKLLSFLIASMAIGISIGHNSLVDTEEGTFHFADTTTDVGLLRDNDYNLSFVGNIQLHINPMMLIRAYFLNYYIASAGTNGNLRSSNERQSRVLTTWTNPNNGQVEELPNCFTTYRNPSHTDDQHDDGLT